MKRLTKYAIEARRLEAVAASMIALLHIYRMRKLWPTFAEVESGESKRQRLDKWIRDNPLPIVTEAWRAMSALNAIYPPIENEINPASEADHAET